MRSTVMPWNRAVAKVPTRLGDLGYESADELRAEQQPAALVAGDPDGDAVGARVVGLR